MLYQNCRELPIHNFNEVIVTDDFKHLIKDNSQHSAEELSNQWQIIVEEYNRISDDQSFKKTLRDKCEIYYLQSKLSACEIILKFKDFELEDEQIQQLNDLKKAFKIRNVSEAHSSTQNKLQLKIEQFQRSQTHEESKSSLGHNIANLSRILGMKINRFTTTVEEWVELLKMADEVIKENSRKNKK